MKGNGTGCALPRGTYTMTSMQDALTEALEHPIAEPPGKPKTHGHSKSRGGKSSSSAPPPLVWGLAGVATSLVGISLYRLLTKSQAQPGASH